MHKRVRYLAIVAVIVLGVIAAVAAQNTSPRVIGGDDAALRLLLSHILTSGPYPDKESVANVGQLPDKLPFDLPLPDDIRVVGSVVHGQGSFIQIILESPHKPDDVTQFFRDALKATDWALYKPETPNGGFYGEPWSSATFCYKAYQSMLRVDAQGTATVTNVDLFITTPADTTACNGATAGTSPSEPFTLLPQLQTPDQVSILPIPNDGRGESIGSSTYPYASTSISIASDLSVSTIADAYAEQLKAKGWKLVTQEAGDKIAWSGWTLTGETGKMWAGSFSLIGSSVINNQLCSRGHHSDHTLIAINSSI